MNNYFVSIHQTISCSESLRGTKTIIKRNGKKLEVTIPAGVRSGSKVRLTGALLLTDNVEGDIYVVIKVRDSSGVLLAFFGITIVLIMAFVMMSIDQVPSTTPTQQASTKVNHEVPGKNSSVFTNGKVVVLINNPNAADPSYSQLMQFLKQDLTDQHEYSEIEYNCVDYAKDLHDRAESAGYRSAWVGIDFIGQVDGHALNAFQTTDRELVYIDVTSGVLDYISPIGTAEEANESWDSVAYVEIGRAYGVIDIDEAKGPTYEYYAAFKANCVLFSLEWNKFTAESDAFDAAFTDPDFSPDEINRWADRLNQWQDRLIAKIETINSCGYESLGIVENIEIKW